jgi:hypothetical protein
MSFWEKIFGTKTDHALAEPRIRFGRYTDSYKDKAQYEAWDASLAAFDEHNYLEAYKIFFTYLRDDKEDNVRWVEEDGGLRFEVLQGSKRISGVADARQVKAEARIVHAKELSVAFMRRLVEDNYSLDYSRYALDDENNLVIKFDTSTLDGSPYKLYYALKEVAVNADKKDDVLLDEFKNLLTPIDMGSKAEISEVEKQTKYNYIKQEIESVLKEANSGKLNADKYPGGISYLLLAVVYKLDFLTIPEGFLMETIERIHHNYFENNNKTFFQKNSFIKKELEKVLERSADQIKAELYATTATFGVLTPKGHDALASLIEGELPNMDWYEENKHERVATSIPTYIVGNALFNYALPKPDRELLDLYYRIIEPDYFKSLGFTFSYFDVAKNEFNQKEIKSSIKKIIDKGKDKYPQLAPDLGQLDFKNPYKFARSYLNMVKNLDFSPKT